MGSLSQNTEETVLIQSDSRLLEGFRYEQEVEHFLRKAVEEDLFEVYYQPVYSIKKQSFITLEALSRLETSYTGDDPAGCFYRDRRKTGTDLRGWKTAASKSLLFYQRARVYYAEHLECEI